MLNIAGNIDLFMYDVIYSYLVHDVYYCGSSKCTPSKE